MPDTHYDLNSSGVGGGVGFGGGGWGGGWGGGGFAPFGLFGLFGLMGRRGFGVDDCGPNPYAYGVTCQDIAGINANVTATGVSVKDMIQAQSLGQLQAISQLALAGQQGMSNLKDSAQAIAVATNANISNLKDAVQIGIAAQGADARELANLINQQTCAIKQMVNQDGDLTRALVNQIDRDRLRDMLDEERHGRRSKDVEISVSQQVTQNQAQLQAQAQQQQQQQAILGHLHSFACRLGQIEQFQAGRFSTGAFNFGAGTVTQTPTNTQNQVGSI